METSQTARQPRQPDLRIHRRRKPPQLRSPDLRIHRRRAANRLPTPEST
jgi:hypothetical protein